MARSVNNGPIALFGGSFNPVHFGHLRIATELAELLQVECIRMMPCALPPGLGAATASQRLDMVQLAINEQVIIQAENIELQMPAPSYSVDTLRLVREQIGTETPLFLCIGMDALNGLDNWHDWLQILDYCHIVVSSRPGWDCPQTGTLADWISTRRCDDLAALKERVRGNIHFCELTMLAVSSTGIRKKIQTGETIRFLTPDSVVNYIQQQHLYE
jgi:nicotinate-nucleotide adenylyltransferase